MFLRKDKVNPEMDETIRKQVRDRRIMLIEGQPSSPDMPMNYDNKENEKHLGYCAVVFYILISLNLSYFVTAPILMLYFGEKYFYCNDIFAPWLIVGGVFHVFTYISFFVNYMNRQQGDASGGENDGKLGIRFLLLLFITIIWYIFGVGRIFTGSINEENKVVEVDICKWYLYNVTFWLTLSPIVLLIPLFFIICYLFNEE